MPLLSHHMFSFLPKIFSSIIFRMFFSSIFRFLTLAKVYYCTLILFQAFHWLISANVYIIYSRTLFSIYMLSMTSLIWFLSLHILYILAQASPLWARQAYVLPFRLSCQPRCLSWQHGVHARTATLMILPIFRISFLAAHYIFDFDGHIITLTRRGSIAISRLRRGRWPIPATQISNGNALLTRHVSMPVLTMAHVSHFYIGLRIMIAQCSFSHTRSWMALRLALFLYFWLERYFRYRLQMMVEK